MGYESAVYPSKDSKHRYRHELSSTLGKSMAWASLCSVPLEGLLTNVAQGKVVRPDPPSRPCALEEGRKALRCDQTSRSAHCGRMVALLLAAQLRCHVFPNTLD